jgi:hypothetical protein
LQIADVRLLIERRTMSDDENEDAVLEAGIELEDEPDSVIGDSSGKEDEEAAGGESQQVPGGREAGRPGEIAREPWAGGEAGGGVPVKTTGERDGARRMENVKRRMGEVNQEMMAGVISRIERLENWVKSNRLG